MNVSVTINGAENAIGILDELQESINEGITRGVSEAGELTLKRHQTLSSGAERSALQRPARADAVPPPSAAPPGSPGHGPWAPC